MLLSRLFGPRSLDSGVKAGRKVSSRGLAVFDIDETLSKTWPTKVGEVRPALARAETEMHSNEAWAGWNKHMRFDIPEQGMLDTARGYKNEGYDVVALSARGEANRGATLMHLDEAGAGDVFDEVWLRPLKHESIGSSGVYKETVMSRRLTRTAQPVAGIYDDSGSVMEAAERMDIKGYKVDPVESTLAEQLHAEKMTDEFAPYHERGVRIDSHIRGRQQAEAEIATRDRDLYRESKSILREAGQEIPVGRSTRAIPVPVSTDPGVTVRGQRYSSARHGLGGRR